MNRFRIQETYSNWSLGAQNLLFFGVCLGVNSKGKTVIDCELPKKRSCFFPFFRRSPSLKGTIIRLSSQWKVQTKGGS